MALLRYHERLGEDGGEPRWFERSFIFPLGRHHIRGRVDRVDELAGGGYELIDYKTGVPKRAEQLRDDVQLALYAVAAREAWQLEATERTYYYVLDDARVRLGVDDGARVLGRGHGRRGRRGHHRAGLRTDPVVRRVRDVRVPDRLPGRRTVGDGCMHPRPGRRMRRPGSAHAPTRPATTGRCRPALAQEALELAREAVARGDVLASRSRSSSAQLLEPLDERLDVGVALDRERRPGARSRPPRSRARSRRRRRRRGPRAGAAARAPPSGWAPRRRSGGRSPTGSPPGSRARRTRPGARRRSRSGPRSRSAQAEPLGQRRIGARAGDVHRQAVRDVGEQRAERDDELHAERLGEVGDDVRERAPAHRRLGAAEQDQVARRARHVRDEDLDRRPDDLAGQPSTSLTFGRTRLEVVELLRVDLREAGRAERAAEERERGGGGVAGVVPAGERADQRRGPQAVRSVLPDQRLHPLHRT